MRIKQHARITILLFITFLLLACHKNSNPVWKQPESSGETAPLAIELEWEFNNNFVRVEFDEKVIFSGRITTNYTISLAWSNGRAEYSIGHHSLKVTEVEKKISGYYEFNLTDTLSVFVRFTPNQSKFIFEQYNGFILRD